MGEGSGKLNDATLPVPNSIEEYGTMLPSGESNKIMDELAKYEEELTNKIGIVVRKIVMETKNKRDPNSSRWREGLPVFICGGGSVLQFYRDVIKDCEKSLKVIGCQSFKILDLPLPEGFHAKGLSPQDYHRLAVAYGLSFTFDDIGKIIPPSDTEDIVPDQRVKDVAYISKDMV